MFVGRFRLWRAIIAAGCLQIICMQEDTHPNIPKKLEIGDWRFGLEIRVSSPAGREMVFQVQ